MKLTFMPYAGQHRATVLGVLVSNVPQYFAAAEADDLAVTLENPDGPHWVIAVDGEVLGYGGFEIGAVYNWVVLTWGMVHADHHRRGLGRALLAHRAREAVRHAPPDTAYLMVDTTPLAAGFYRRCGFEEVACWPRGYRAGFDMVQLRMPFGSAAMAALVSAPLARNIDP